MLGGGHRQHPPLGLGNLARLALVFRLRRAGRELTLQDGRPDDPYSSLQKSKILFRRPSWATSRL